MELLAYTSEAAAGIDGSDVFQIVAQSARNNAENQVTGILLFRSGKFFQIVEGPRDALDGLMLKLERDNRHSKIKVLGRTVTKERIFPAWNMKRLYNAFCSEDMAAINEKLEPLRISDEACAEFAKFVGDDSRKAA
ncbi:MAG: BLUF domain-containing protein [Marinomonas sp.]